MTDDDLLFLPAVEQAALIAAKSLSPVELTEAYLARAEALNPRLNAFITIAADHARAAARRAEAEILRDGPRSALHGVPYAPKDILATAGVRTTNGSKVTADHTPDFDSTVTRRLDEAGAVMMGKANLSEFAMGSSVVSGFGPSRNPWDDRRSPAGSSSGSAVAVAAGMTSLTIGTDTGGSIRGPAAFCGVVGIKATYGRVSRYGVTPLAWSLDHAGPMTRTVADAAAMLQIIAGQDARDRTTTGDPVPAYAAGLGGDLKGVRVGVPKRHFAAAEPEVQAAVDAAVRQIADLGATLVEVDVPHALYAPSAGFILTLTEAAAFHEKRMAESPGLFDPIIRERMEAARFYTALDYIKAQRIRSVLMDEMAQVFETCDVMATPGAAGVAGMLDPPELAATDVRPGSQAPTFRPGVTFLANMTGLPALALPCGFSGGGTPLPIGLQLIGRAFDEALLFRVGHAYEQAAGHFRRRPAL